MSSIQYTVKALIEGSERVDVQWYDGTSLAQAISAMVEAAAHDESAANRNVPESVRYRTLAVSLTIEHPEPPEPDDWTLAARDIKNEQPDASSSTESDGSVIWSDPDTRDIIAATNPLRHLSSAERAEVSREYVLKNVEFDDEPTTGPEWFDLLPPESDGSVIPSDPETRTLITDNHPDARSSTEGPGFRITGGMHPMFEPREPDSQPVLDEWEVEPPDDEDRCAQGCVCTPQEKHDANNCDIETCDLGPHDGARSSIEGFTFDDLDMDVALDDCVYWPRPEANCSGRMAQRTDEDGTTFVCEHHLNHPPTP